MIYICCTNIGAFMEKKLRFLQEYVLINPDKDFGYLVLIETLDDVPTGNCFIVKIPVAHHFYDEVRYYATSPN